MMDYQLLIRMKEKEKRKIIHFALLVLCQCRRTCFSTQDSGCRREFTALQIY